MVEVARWAWALLVPPVIMVLLMRFAPNSGALGWLTLGAAVAVGAVAFALADWRESTKMIALILYVPLMGFVVVMTAVLAGCSIIGCH